MSYAKLKAHLETLIAQHGMAVNPVMPSGENPPFAYSIGQHDKGLPELLVFGLPPQVAGGLLYTLAAYLEGERAAGQFVGPGVVSLEGASVPTALIEVTAVAAREYATVADDRSDGQATYLQAVWPDQESRFPWDVGYAEDLRRYQLILGAPPTLPAGTTLLH